MRRKPFKVERKTQESMRASMLKSLSEGDKGAILVTCEDLDMLIEALAALGTEKAREFRADMLQFRVALFGGNG